MDLQLLSLLADGRFRSGQALGAHLGVSRTAIAKRIQRQIRDFGFQVQSVPGKGYRLSEPISLLRAEQLRAAFHEWGWDLECLTCVDSTSLECRRRLLGGRGKPLLIIAENQTGGRGRRGRSWISGACQNLTASLKIDVPFGVKDLPAASLIVGLAVSRVLDSHCGSRTALKWPNDVYVAGRKIAGILLELSGDPSDACSLIIGVGVNVNMRSAVIDQAWTSLSLEAGALIDRTALAITLFAEVGRLLAEFFSKGFEPFMAEWEARQQWRNLACTLGSGDGQVSGVVLGVAADGALRMNVNGEEVRLRAGELSLRAAQ